MIRAGGVPVPVIVIVIPVIAVVGVIRAGGVPVPVIVIVIRDAVGIGAIVGVVRDRWLNGRFWPGLGRWLRDRLRFGWRHGDHHFLSWQFFGGGTNLDHDGPPVPLFQIRPGLLLLLGLPVSVGAGNCDGHRLSAGEIAHGNGPVHQFLSHFHPVLTAELVPIDQ